MGKIKIMQKIVALSDENKLKQIEEIIDAKEVSLAEMKLDDGVTVLEAEVFEADQPVNVKTEDGQLIPVPVGEYKLEDGMILVVAEEGIIAEIKEEVAEEEAAPEEEEVAASDKATATPTAPKSVIESVVKETKFSKEEIDAKDEEIVALKAQIAELTKEEVEEVTEEVELAKPIAQNPEKKAEPFKYTIASNSRKNSTKDRVMNRISNI